MMVTISKRCLHRGKRSILEALGGQSRSHLLLFAHRFVLGQLAGVPKESTEEQGAIFPR